MANWFLKHKQRLLAKIDWQHQDKPTLMAWLQKGCPNNLKEVRKIYKPIIIVIVIFGLLNFAIFSYASKDYIDIIISFFIVCFFCTPFALMIYSQFKGTKTYCYRITPLGIEQASWKNFYDQVKMGLNGIFIVLFIMMIFMFITDPEIIFVGLGGMVGVALINGGVFYSEGFADRTRAARQEMMQWKGELASKRYKCIVIDRQLRLIVIDQEPSQCTVKGYSRKSTGILLFCNKRNIDQLAELLTQYLPHLPHIEGSARLTPP